MDEYSSFFKLSDAVHLNSDLINVFFQMTDHTN